MLTKAERVNFLALGRVAIERKLAPRAVEAREGRIHCCQYHLELARAQTEGRSSVASLKTLGAGWKMPPDCVVAGFLHGEDKFRAECFLHCNRT